MPELAYCGLNCEECPAYQATVASDTSHQIWLASEYSSPAQLYGPLDMVCFGCHSQRYVSRMCRTCEVRRCAMAQVEHTCAECGRFPCQLSMPTSATWFDAGLIWYAGWAIALS